MYVQTIQRFAGLMDINNHICTQSLREIEVHDRLREINVLTIIRDGPIIITQCDRKALYFNVLKVRVGSGLL